MGKSILFINADDDRQFDEADASLITFLEGLGHDVNDFAGEETEADTEAAAAAVDLVVISESVSSQDIRTEITEVNVPMLIFEMYAWDEMGLATGADGGVTSPDAATTNINVINPDHPLAVGRSGVVSVFSSLEGGPFEDSDGIPRLADSTAGTGATVIAQATLSDGGTYDEIFVYEKGAPLALAPGDGSDQVAANMRICIGFDMRSVPVWNDYAYDIYEAAVNYALKLQKPTEAYVPVPANGAVEVPRAVVLKWRPGRLAATHNVYFGTDFNDVNEATPEDDRGVLLKQDYTERSLDVGVLDYGTTYYWRVDEANAAPDTTVYTGHVWSFEILNYRVIDNFEAYTNFYPNRIFDAWIDGWANPDENGAIVGYDYTEQYPNASTRDQDVEDAGLHYVETYIGQQSMPLFYDTDMKISEATLPLADVGYTTDWTADDVNDLSLWFKGARGVVTSWTEEAGVHTIIAAGADIFYTSDEFHFVYKEMTGNAVIVAKVESIEPINDWVRAGVMIRDTLDGNARNAACLLTPGNGVRGQYRTTTGGETDRVFDPNLLTPYWVKIDRSLGGITRYYTSADGSNWDQLTLKVVSMVDPIYVGIAGCSHDPDLTAEVVLSNVTINGASVADWQNQDVGIQSNSDEDMYVVLNNQAVVYYEETDPNMPASPTLIKDWHNWSIPLQSFADQGVDLTQVNTLKLGVGTRGDMTSSGGSGLLYVDDIRLYRPPVE